MADIKIEITKHEFEGGQQDYCIKAAYKQHTVYKVEHDEEKAKATAEQLKETLPMIDNPFPSKK